MSALGNSASMQVFQPAIDYFSGNGATSQFTLSRPVASVAQMIVSVANVIQNPNTFSVNNNILTLGGNAPVGTNNIWVQYQTSIVQLNQPGQGTVGTNQLMDQSVTAGKIATATISPDKLSVGAPSWDASGRVTMPYQPAVNARLVNTTSYSTDTVFKPDSIQLNRGNHYSASTGMLTAPVGGVYRITGNFLIRAAGTSAGALTVSPSKNGVRDTGYGAIYTGTMSGEICISGNFLVPLAANDTLSLVVGGTPSTTIQLYGQESFMTIQLIG